MTHDNGVETTYTYDVASQLLSLVHELGATAINSFTYIYDDAGNRLSKIDNSGTASYTYDSLNRLTEAMNPLPSNPLESFTYDEVGNRVDSNQNGLSTFNAANQLAENAEFTYAYDANGNQIQKTDRATLLSTQFEYDAENQLIRVVREDSSVVTYKYDGLGRRIEKEVIEAAVTTVTRYIYDQEDILLELDGSNNITARYTHGPGIDEPGIIQKAGASFFYHADGLGSITELTNTAGTVVQSYTYSSFGNIESQLDGNFIQPYTYTAREFDGEVGLYHYRKRSYDQKIGRFNTVDPIGFSAGSLNLYLYVGNNPTRFTDPYGKFAALPDCTNASPVCDEYGRCDDYLGANARCFCKCAGNDPWSLMVRCCLAKAAELGLSPNQGHALCYGAATSVFGVHSIPVVNLAVCVVKCSREQDKLCSSCSNF